MLLNNRSIIRFLSGLTFLVFFCPFFQTCSNNSIQELPKIKEAKSIEIKQTLINKAKIENTLNGYEFAYLFISDNISEKKSIIDLTDFKDSSISFSLILCLLLSGIILFKTLLPKENSKQLFMFSIANLIVVCFSFISIIFSRYFEEINQIKIGYYLFVFISVTLTYFCFKNLKSSK